MLILISLVSLGFNYYLYKENRQFKERIGVDYSVAVRKTIFELNDDFPDYLIREFEKGDGGILLGGFSNELDKLSGQFHRMNSSVSVVGMELDTIIDHLFKLKKAVDNKEGVEEMKQDINEHVTFVLEILEPLEKFGDDSMRWYKVLSDPASETSDRILEKYNEYIRKNQ